MSGVSPVGLAENGTHSDKASCELLFMWLVFPNQPSCLPLLATGNDFPGRDFPPTIPSPSQAHQDRMTSCQQRQVRNLFYLACLVCFHPPLALCLRLIVPLGEFCLRRLNWMPEDSNSDYQGERSRATDDYCRSPKRETKQVLCGTASRI